MIHSSCQHPWLALVVTLFWLAHSWVEYWLGKTDRFKANSMWEIVLTGVAALFVILFKRRGNDGKGCEGR